MVGPETLARMSPEDRTRLENMPVEIEEDARAATNGHVASSISDLMTSTEVRYRTETIVGIEKPVRFKSLTARHFLAVAEEEDRNILKYSVCDENGNAFINDDDLNQLQGDGFDARTLMHMLAVANDHCLAGATLEGLTEAAAKN